MTTSRSNPRREIVPARVVDFHVPVSHWKPRVTARRSHFQGTTAAARVGDLQVLVSRGEPRVTACRSDSRGAIIPARVAEIQEPVSRGDTRVTARFAGSQGTTAATGGEDLMKKFNILRILYRLKSAEAVILRSELQFPQEREREAEAWLRHGGI